MKTVEELEKELEIAKNAEFAEKFWAKREEIKTKYIGKCYCEKNLTDCLLKRQHYHARGIYANACRINNVQVIVGGCYRGKIIQSKEEFIKRIVDDPRDKDYCEVVCIMDELRIDCSKDYIRLDRESNSSKAVMYTADERICTNGFAYKHSLDPVIFDALFSNTEVLASELRSHLCSIDKTRTTWRRTVADENNYESYINHLRCIGQKLIELPDWAMNCEFSFHPYVFGEMIVVSEDSIKIFENEIRNEKRKWNGGSGRTIEEYQRMISFLRDSLDNHTYFPNDHIIKDWYKKLSKEERRLICKKIDPYEKSLKTFESEIESKKLWLKIYKYGRTLVS